MIERSIDAVHAYHEMLRYFKTIIDGIKHRMKIKLTTC